VSESEMAMNGHGGALMEESPYSIPSRKLTVWLFIISDAVTFGAILFAYGYLRVATPDWQTPFKSGSIINAAVMGTAPAGIAGPCGRCASINRPKTPINTPSTANALPRIATIAAAVTAAEGLAGSAIARVYHLRVLRERITKRHILQNFRLTFAFFSPKLESRMARSASAARQRDQWRSPHGPD